MAGSIYFEECLSGLCPYNESQFCSKIPLLSILTPHTLSLYGQKQNRHSSGYLILLFTIKKSRLELHVNKLFNLHYQPNPSITNISALLV